MGRPATTVTAWADLRAQFLEAQAYQCAICRNPLAPEDAQLDRPEIEAYLSHAAEYIARPARPTARTRVVRVGNTTAHAHIGPSLKPPLLNHGA